MRNQVFKNVSFWDYTFVIATIITVDKTIREVALEIGAKDDQPEDGNPDIYIINERNE